MSTDPTILICAGATKAGTSWLHRHLASHPECHFRTIKELHYFDTVQTGNFDRQLRLTAERLAALPPEAARRRRDLSDWRTVLERRREDIPAYLGYLAAGRGRRRLLGDITPAYGLLPVETLRRIAGMAPDVRFVYLLRDPVARLWSQVRMLAARRVRDAAQLARQAHRLMETVLSGGEVQALERGDYAGALGRLDAALDPRRLCVLFQEELMSPAGLARLSGFLGIRTAPAEFDRRVHEGVSLPLDEGLRARACALLRPQYDYAAARFPELPDSWRRNMSEVHG